MNIAIEHLQLSELVTSLREQADDAFPNLKDEQRLKILAEKWCMYAVFCTCRDEDGQLVGMIAFYANQPDTKIAYIPHIYVSKEFRCHGVFAQMLNRVIQYVKLQEFQQIKLEVSKDNMIAIRAYLKQGFKTCKGVIEKSIYMTKQL